MMLLWLVYVLLPFNATAWSPYIHMVIMRVAMRSMDPTAIDALDRVLAAPKWAEAYPEMKDLTTASIFADVILFPDHKPSAFEPLHAPQWHFTNIQTGNTRFRSSSAKKRVSRPGNPYDNTKNAAFILEKTVRDWDKTDSRWYLNFLLRYFIHVLPDSHQPLHASSDDGNRINFEKKARCRNLHKLWDLGVKLFPNAIPWMPLDGPITREVVAQLELDADRLVQDYVFHDDLIDWETLETMPFAAFQETVANEFLLRLIIDETHQVAENYVRDGIIQKPNATPTFACPDQEYMDRGQRIAAEQILKAGWRVSRFLNIFGKQLIENDRVDLN